MGDSFDFIVVGAGSAGRVPTNRLSADGRYRGLLLETGGRDRNPWLLVPVGNFMTLHEPFADWCCATKSNSELSGRSLERLRGKTLGASNSVNGLLYVRGQAQDCDH